MNASRAEPFTRLRVERDLSGAYPAIDSRWSDMRAGSRELVGVFLSHPIILARVEAGLAIEMARIALGWSQLAPDPDDRRFEHEAWQTNPLFRRVLQGYLAWSQALLELLDSLQLSAGRRRRLLFAARHLIAAGAPSNLFVTHPEFYRNAVTSRGLSVVTGLRHIAEDLRYNHGLPRQVDTTAFRLGRNIAATEGAVIFRNEICELIQYSPRTPQVDGRPVLFVPPQINKYYVVDLSPDKSFIRHALDAGQQFFSLSWRNPTAAQRGWGLAEYVQAVIEAIEVVQAVGAGAPVKLMGACAGGLTATLALAVLAARGQQERIACLSLFVTMLESPRADSADRSADRAAIRAALARSSTAGVLDGADMARAFAWLRPDDLIWHFVTNNYVLGREPPAFDVLYWNSDTTRLPARLHADLLAIYRDNALHEDGGLTVDDVPIDLSKIDRDVFVVAGERDHITPWQSCFRSMQMFRANTRFVLGGAGHVQSIVCPPGSGHARFFIHDDYALTPEAWRKAAKQQDDSWWPAWVRWSQAHGGDTRVAPDSYGNDDFEPIEAAPGRYVRQR
ncbi:MAG: alpha/beta fold hydrolase [Salinisphaera sp.]|jgi:polyhydroxyalkanoate synthase|nr:alpha/beta fold hydrolase [Salinisphaera sp.]